jgi:hypothetical protein
MACFYLWYLGLREEPIVPLKIFIKEEIKVE